MTDREFLIKHQEHEITASVGYVRNLDEHIALRFAEIYRDNVDRKYVFTKYCGDCVMDLVKRVYQWFRNEETKANAAQPAETTQGKENAPEGVQDSQDGPGGTNSPAGVGDSKDSGRTRPAKDSKGKPAGKEGKETKV
jgi:hypothetical protein